MNNYSRMLRKTAALSLAVALLTASAPAFGAAPILNTAAAASSAAQGIPLRPAAAQIGATVTWDEATRTATVTLGDSKLVLFIAEGRAQLNGQPFEIGQPLHVVKHQTHIPADLLARAFNEAGQQDAASRLAAALLAGDADSAYAVLSPAMKQAIGSAQQLGVMWSGFEQYLGKPEQELGRETTSNSVHTNTAITYKSAKTAFVFTIRVSKDGLVDDFNLVPSVPSKYQKPDYDKGNYTQQEIKLGDGSMALPGTLTLPKGTGPFPAVVLVHGSGPHDRDSSIGSAKVFRDLAVGLASQQIAVLQYDKVTYEHTVKMSSNQKITIQEETVQDALAAVQLLANTPGIDSSRIYVAGHSQGGFAVPLIVEADRSGSIAGSIMLAAPAGRFQDLLAEQQQELLARLKELKLPAETIAAQEQALQFWQSAVNVINDRQYSTDKLPAQFPLQPAYWWYALRDYKAAETAASQKGRLLVLQGENDWQVPLKELTAWKDALKDRTDVTFKSYPNVNHLLAEYKGLSVGSEYYEPANVSFQLIQDMAAFINNSSDASK